MPGGTQRPGGHSLKGEKGDTTSTAWGETLEPAERPAAGDSFLAREIQNLIQSREVCFAAG
jgi:hypothetical protein